MAIHRSLGKITTPLSHLPTWFFIIGYPMYWLQLYTHTASDGVTSPVSWILFGIIAIFIGSAGPGSSLVSGAPDSSAALSATRKVVSINRPIGQSPSAPDTKSSPPADTQLNNYEKFFWTAASVIALIIIGIVVIASLKPIHLLQEYDCLQYHYTLPRQHLILGSFAHIPWAADDLFLLPVDFALAPFWFATLLPNKIPQLIIFFGLISVAVRLTSALATERRPLAGPLAVLVILGTHGFGIQMGTGMLDLAIAYLFLASLDSLRLGNWFLAGVEFTFFFWSKPLMPLGVMITMGAWALCLVIARRSHWQITGIVILNNWKKALGLFTALSVVVAGPFIVKSIYYAATPFFPLAPGFMGTWGNIQIHPLSWHSLQQASQLWMGSNSYGHGQGLLSFIKHWWLLAVPEKGVNNTFDYPLGLTYLLMIGPFLFFLVKDILRRKFPLLSVLAAVIWGLWWFTAQQSRFLYVPLLIVFIVTLSRLEKVSRGLFLCLLISLFLEALSLWGAHKSDMGKWGVDVLRTQDKQLLELNLRYREHFLSNYIDWPSHDAAYAQFPVMVHKENLPHTIFF